MRAAKELVTKILGLVERARPVDWTWGFTSPQDVLGALGEAEAIVTDIPGRLEALAARKGDVLRSLSDLADSRIAARVVETLTPLTREALGVFFGQLRRFPSVSAAIGAGISSFLSGSVAGRVAEGLQDLEAVTPRKIDDIVDGTVILDEVASPGDKLEIRVGLVDAEREHVQRLHVIGRGLYPTLDSHLIFVNRIREPGGDVARTEFDAAPSISWTLHYRMEEGTRNASSIAPIWNTLDWGFFGLNVSALGFEDSVEVGVGVHWTFVNDLVQVGYGWNLNVGEDRDYFFIGIGLIEGLDRIGVDLGKRR